MHYAKLFINLSIVIGCQLTIKNQKDGKLVYKNYLRKESKVKALATKERNQVMKTIGPYVHTIYKAT